MDLVKPLPRPPKRTPWDIQRAVLFALFQRELKARVGGRWLGLFWVFLEPLAHVAFMMAIYTFVRHRIVPGMPVPIFLITGVIPFVVFRSLSTRLMASVDNNRGLFGYRQVKPIDPVIARGALETLLYTVVYAVSLAVLGWFFDLQWWPAKPLELMATSAVIAMQGFGLGLVLVVLTDDVSQVRILIRLMFMPLYMMSGVIFPVRTLSQDTIDVLAWNPLLHLIEMSRSFFTPEYPLFQHANLTYPASTAVVTLAVGLALYRVRRQQLMAR